MERTNQEHTLTIKKMFKNVLSGRRKMIPEGNTDLHKCMESTGNGSFFMFLPLSLRYLLKEKKMCVLTKTYTGVFTASSFLILHNGKHSNVHQQARA